MDAKFSASTREMIGYSREEAIRLKNKFIGIEHIILGILRHGESTGLKVLVYMKVDLVKLGDTIVQQCRTTYESFENDPNFDKDKEKIVLLKQAEKMLKVTFLEAKKAKKSQIEIEHVIGSILNPEYNFDERNILEMVGVTYESYHINLKRLEGLPAIPETSIEAAKPSNANPISLVFNRDEFTNDEIAQMVVLLSDLYFGVANDELEIVGASSLQLIAQFECA